MTDWVYLELPLRGLLVCFWMLLMDCFKTSKFIWLSDFYVDGTCAYPPKLPLFVLNWIFPNWGYSVPYKYTYPAPVLLYLETKFPVTWAEDCVVLVSISLFYIHLLLLSDYCGYVDLVVLVFKSQFSVGSVAPRKQSTARIDRASMSFSQTDMLDHVIE